MRNIEKNAVFFLFFLLIFPAEAYSYIDMSTGSYVIQLAIAGICGVLFTIKGYGRALKAKIMSKFKSRSTKKLS